MKMQFSMRAKYVMAIGLCALGLAGISASWWRTQAQNAEISTAETSMPEFGHQTQAAWLNSPPLKAQDLKGQVVLLDDFALHCVPCQVSFPWVHKIEAKYGPMGLKIIEVHSPVAEWEKRRENVERFAKKFGLKNPIYLDNDSVFSDTLKSEGWPAFYLVDKHGKIRLSVLGAVESGDKQAILIERTISQLLTET